jgi:hypothetical protein
LETKQFTKGLQNDRGQAVTIEGRVSEVTEVPKAVAEGRMGTLWLGEQYLGTKIAKIVSPLSYMSFMEFAPPGHLSDDVQCTSGLAKALGLDRDFLPDDLDAR